MKLPPLNEGRLIKRYKRFLADVEFESGIETVHCPNPGAMTGLKDPGLKVWCSVSDNPKRKLKKTLELVEVEGGLVGIHTGRPNAVAEEALLEGHIPELKGWSKIQREFTWRPGTRFDFCLRNNTETPGMLLEVKNVHLVRPMGPNPGAAEFPDSITARGTKHLKHLAESLQEGWQASMLYVVQRSDVNRFTTAEDIDPVYAKELVRVSKLGVQVHAWTCSISLEEIRLDAPLPIVLG